MPSYHIRTRNEQTLRISFCLQSTEMDRNQIRSTYNNNIENKILLRFFLLNFFLEKGNVCDEYMLWVWVNEENAFPCCSLGDK